MKKNKKIVVFASGSGTNFINIYDNAVNGKIVLLISNNPSCGAVQYAIKNFGSIPENINFGIKSSVVENLIQAHNVNNPSPYTKEMKKSDLGYNIKQATLYLYQIEWHHLSRSSSLYLIEGRYTIYRLHFLYYKSYHIYRKILRFH